MAAHAPLLRPNPLATARRAGHGSA